VGKMCPLILPAIRVPYAFDRIYTGNIPYLALLNLQNFTFSGPLIPNSEIAPHSAIFQTKSAIIDK
jgi:hypothetical protein